MIRASLSIALVAAAIAGCSTAPTINKVVVPVGVAADTQCESTEVRLSALASTAYVVCAKQGDVKGVVAGSAEPWGRAAATLGGAALAGGGVAGAGVAIGKNLPQAFSIKP